MCDRRWLAVIVLLLVSLAGRLSAQESAPWHDPSPHTIQFVTVDKDVKLEVLDWGGTGRSVVLGSGVFRRSKSSPEALRMRVRGLF